MLRDLGSGLCPCRIGRCSGIVDRIEVLQTFTDIGPRYPTRGGIHREVLCYDYRIFYRVDHEARVVYIARVWHGRQNPTSLEL